MRKRDDQLIQLLFSITTPEDRSDALGQLGWQFLNDGREEPVGIRAQALVDWRTAEIRTGGASTVELGGFHWWIKSNRFPADWWLPLLDLAATIPAFDPHSALGAALAEAAVQFPQQTVSLLSQLLPDEGLSWQRYDMVENAPAILAAALDSDNVIARDIAKKVINRLGREGYTDLDEP